MSWKKVLLIKKRIVLNYRFSNFQPFTHDIITRIPPIAIYVSSGHSTSVSFGKGKGVDEESNKKALKGERAVKKVISLTQIPLCTFFCSSMSTFWFPHEVLISLQQAIKNTSKKEPTSVSETTIQNLHKNIKILLLCQSGLFINARVSKNSIVFKDVIFCLRWYNVICWSSHICKKSFSLPFYSFLGKFCEWHRGNGTVKLTKCDKVEWDEKCHYANDILFEWPHV